MHTYRLWMQICCWLVAQLWFGSLGKFDLGEHWQLILRMNFLLQDKKEKWISMFSDLFVFFATSQFKHVFKEHLHYLVRSFKISPVHLLSRFFTDEGALIFFFFKLFFLVLDYCPWKHFYIPYTAENKLDFLYLSTFVVYLYNYCFYFFWFFCSVSF